jgi:hypothetical protein
MSTRLRTFLRIFIVLAMYECALKNKYLRTYIYAIIDLVLFSTRIRGELVPPDILLHFAELSSPTAKVFITAVDQSFRRRVGMLSKREHIILYHIYQMIKFGHHATVMFNTKTQCSISSGREKCCQPTPYPVGSEKSIRYITISLRSADLSE